MFLLFVNSQSVNVKVRLTSNTLIPFPVMNCISWLFVFFPYCSHFFWMRLSLQPVFRRIGRNKFSFFRFPIVIVVGYKGQVLRLLWVTLWDCFSLCNSETFCLFLVHCECFLFWFRNNLSSYLPPFQSSALVFVSLTLYRPLFFFFLLLKLLLLFLLLKLLLNWWKLKASLKSFGNKGLYPIWFLYLLGPRGCRFLPKRTVIKVVC